MSEDASQVPSGAQAPGHDGPACFGPYELDLARGDLRRLGRPVRIEPLPMRILVILVTEAGRLVPRGELYERAWHEREHATERGLNTSIRHLRRALGDSARSPRYIEAVPRRGYRFIAPLEPRVLPSVPATARRPTRGSKVAAYAAALGVVTIAAVLLERDVDRTQPGLPAPAASSDYAVARALMKAERPADYHRAIPFLERVTRVDPTFVPAHSQLATARFFSGDLDGAEAAAAAALARDADRVEALVAMAHVLALRDWDWRAARRTLDRALRLAPDERKVLHSQAFIRALTGEADAISWMVRAHELDPLSASVNGDLGLFYFWNGRHEAALEHCRRALAIAVESWLLECAYDAARRAGRREEAEQLAASLLAASGAPQPAAGGASDAYRRLRVVQAREAVSRGHKGAYTQLALYLADLGQREAALEALELATAHRSMLLPTLAIDPRMDAVRGEPRFRAVLARMGLDNRAVARTDPG